jgi:putative sigma-54 modulation protein
MQKKERAAQFVGQEYAIHVTGRSLQVTEAMKNYAIEKVQKIEKFTDRIIDVNITMDIQKLNHRVEIMLSACGTKIRSHATTTDMYVSIDQAVDRLETQIRRYLSRLHDHHAITHEEQALIVHVLESLTDGETGEIEEINNEIQVEASERLNAMYAPRKLVRQEMLPVKTLSIEDAIMKMDLSQDPFLLFKGEHNRKLNVIYRQEDGNYAVVVPEIK